MMSITTRFGQLPAPLSPPARPGRAGIAPALDAAHGAATALEGRPGMEIVLLLAIIGLALITLKRCRRYDRAHRSGWNVDYRDNRSRR
jgi:hypothetical protein